MLVDAGLALVGTDRLTVDASTVPDFTLHRLLLEAGCVIVEGLDLSGVVPGLVRAMCSSDSLCWCGGEPEPRVLIRSSRN